MVSWGYGLWSLFGVGRPCVKTFAPPCLGSSLSAIEGKGGGREGGRGEGAKGVFIAEGSEDSGCQGLR